ncbi:hypothetical protein FACS1894178_8020 [Bacteroidia bacterium]|nr:hypothetical protein FACS1894178_8020 [Bacteroidia bacterium]
MEKEENIITMLNSGQWHLLNNVNEELKKQKLVSDRVLKCLLELPDNSDNRLIQGDFLEEFEYFTSSQLKVTELFIHQRINDRDGVFVSSLIGCANFNYILSLHDICIEFIKRRIQNHIVVLAAIDYLFEHMNFHDIDRIVSAFNRVLNNKKYYQNCQTAASFFLFRITHHQKYYDFLKGLVLEGGEINHIVLKNKLQGMDYNKRKYFAYFDDLMAIVKKREKINK